MNPELFAICWAEIYREQVKHDLDLIHFSLIIISILIDTDTVLAIPSPMPKRYHCQNKWFGGKRDKLLWFSATIAELWS